MFLHGNRPHVMVMGRRLLPTAFVECRYFPEDPLTVTAAASPGLVLNTTAVRCPVPEAVRATRYSVYLYFPELGAQATGLTEGSMTLEIREPLLIVGAQPPVVPANQSSSM